MSDLLLITLSAIILLFVKQLFLIWWLILISWWAELSVDELLTQRYIPCITSTLWTAVFHFQAIKRIPLSLRMASPTSHRFRSSSFTTRIPPSNMTLNSRPGSRADTRRTGLTLKHSECGAIHSGRSDSSRKTGNRQPATASTSWSTMCASTSSTWPWNSRSSNFQPMQTTRRLEPSRREDAKEWPKRTVSKDRDLMLNKMFYLIRLVNVNIRLVNCYLLLFNCNMLLFFIFSCCL